MTYQGYKAIMFLLEAYTANDSLEIKVYSGKRRQDGMPALMFYIGDDCAALTLKQVAYLPSCCELAISRTNPDEARLRGALNGLAQMARRAAAALNEGVSPHGPH